MPPFKATFHDAFLSALFHERLRAQHLNVDLFPDQTA